MERPSLIDRSRVVAAVLLCLAVTACGISDAGSSCASDSDCADGLTCHEQDMGTFSGYRKICTRLCATNDDCADLGGALVGNAPSFVCGDSCGGDSICVDDR